MAFISALPAMLISVGLGFVLGCIPFVQNWLHWNFWFVIPISGLVYGLIVGYSSFKLLHILNCRASGAVILILVISAAAGFAAIDLGRYLTYVVDGRNGQVVRIAAVMSFFEFLGPQFKNFWHSLSYVVDLLGAMAAAFGAILVGADDNPYCARCNRYKSKETEFEVLLDGEEIANKLFAEITVLIEDGDYPAFRDFCVALQEQGNPAAGVVKVTFDERKCAACEARTMFGVFEFVDDEGDWSENSDFKFTMTSDANVRISPDMQPRGDESI